MSIQVKNLTKHYEYYKKEVGLKNSLKNLFYRKKYIKEAVNDVTFEIEQGELVGFLGPNGAGKTTTLKMLAGILFPTEGDASVLGFTPWERKKEFKMKFSIIMGQKNQLWWDLPAGESFFLNKCIYEVDDKKYKLRLEELAELLDVKNLLNVQVRRLSLGERMKMEVISALLHEPNVIFLDEPTIGLDLLSQRKIRDFLKFYNQQKKATILLTSHYMDDIRDLCKRTIIINHGQLVYDGLLSEINNVFSGKKIIKLRLTDYVDKATFESFGTVMEFDGLSATIEVDRKHVNQYSMQILEKLPVMDFNIEDIPIEEGIAMIYQKGNHSNEAKQ